MRFFDNWVSIVAHGLEYFRMLYLDVLVQTTFRAVWLAAALYAALIMSCNLRCRPSNSPFFLVDLPAVSIWEFLGFFFEFEEFSDELVFLEVEFLELSGENYIGEM